MNKLKWRVLSVNHALTTQQGNETAYMVTLSAVAGGMIQGGQLTLRLSAPPAYGPGDVIGNDLGGADDDDHQAEAKQARDGKPKEGAQGAGKAKTGGAA